ncbi:EF-hand domain-containing protein [Celeribacter indicus]|uniref:Calcium-binding EF-hand domain-containing protein n=1 Tax=Celeribacter indicus TaxID=1208324 RepID=A0A0B5DYI2_9RHOB|nr:EF-hand domain-containing protein [Celeribacter indicus]AJE48064.1 calcium-binding EF-hand domain-containing protein [Celeribacter indicus]SDW31691.1 Ca2+-binding protein, EF-hand superfamily [Celeribacter indicus]
MKRNVFVSGLALAAVFAGSVAAFAGGSGSGGWGRHHGMEGRSGHPWQGGMMSRMGGGMMPFGAGADFAEIDADGDGQVSESELTAFRDARFAEIDTDGNGTADAEELFAYHEAQRAARMRAMTEKMVAARDTDGDGALSVEELTTRPQPTMFQRLDRNGDGVLSEDEFGRPRGTGAGGQGTMQPDAGDD